MGKKEKKELEHQLTAVLASFFVKKNDKLAAGMEKSIKSSSKDLAKKYMKLYSRADEERLKSGDATRTGKAEPKRSEVASVPSQKKSIVRPSPSRKKRTVKKSVAKRRK